MKGLRLETVGDLLDQVADRVEPCPAPGPATDSPIITAAGKYPPSLVPIEDYHGREVCPAPSISSSGLRLLRTRSPRHYWWQSAMNPNRPKPADRRHFAFGRAVHDILLLGDRWPQKYHVLPDGFSRAKSREMAAEIEEAAKAEAAGKTILSSADAENCRAAAASVLRDPLLARALGEGLSEWTFAWQDQLTSVWLRARPDCIAPNRPLILDIKTADDASPAALERAARFYGYLEQAALYIDGYRAVTGEEAAGFLLVAVEREPPFVVATYPVDVDDVQRVRARRVRPAIDLFARCLETDEWPGYPEKTIGLAAWERRLIDQELEL